MLKTQGLTLLYGGAQILHYIDFEAKVDEVTCIMGTNGVDTTSFLRALAGTHPRSGGTVAIADVGLGRLRPQAMARHGVAVVPQGRMIFPLLTVQENMETAFALLPRAEWRVPAEIYDLFPVPERISFNLIQIEGNPGQDQLGNVACCGQSAEPDCTQHALKDMARRRGGDLSGGQQQQLVIARAMIMQPKILRLDEPTKGIQPNIIQQIGRVIEHLKAEGKMAIVLVEQYFDFAYGLADQFYVFRGGSVSLSGPTA